MRTFLVVFRVVAHVKPPLEQSQQQAMYIWLHVCNLNVKIKLVMKINGSIANNPKITRQDGPTVVFKIYGIVFRLNILYVSLLRRHLTNFNDPVRDHSAVTSLNGIRKSMKQILNCFLKYF